LISQHRNHTQSRKRQPPQFELVAGNAGLDFINTLDDRFTEPKELLTSYADLVRFGEDSEILTPSDADILLKQSGAEPEKAQKALRKAVELREAMYAIFEAIAKKKRVPIPALATLNEYIQEAAGRRQLKQANGRFERRLDYLGSLDSVSWAIALTAADLLTSDQLPFVHTCSSPTCQWFFLDTSKNHRRRWCDMKACGNRAKVRRFYANQKKHSQAHG
jgi:predicted RNA-binding Zn ribbon-like protein